MLGTAALAAASIFFAIGIPEGQVPAQSDVQQLTSPEARNPVVPQIDPNARSSGDAASAEEGAGDAATGSASQAESRDLQLGASLTDESGEPLGVIESVNGNVVIVSTGTIRAQISASTIRMVGGRLVSSVTRVQIESAAIGGRQGW